MNLKPLIQLPTLFVQAALVATATLLAIVLVSRFVAPLPISISQVTTQKDAAFIASGKSSISTQPDQANVSLGITAKGSDLKTAQDHANTIINGYTKQLTDLGISADNLKTTNYTIYPNYDYQTNAQKINGYTVNISLDVTLKEADFTKVNQVVDLATAAGLNEVGNIQFRISDTKEKEIRLKAREQAITDAKQNAQELARLAGVQLGKVINVTENSGSVPQPIMMAKDVAPMAVGASAPTTIQPGSTSYDYSVTLSYETL